MLPIPGAFLCPQSCPDSPGIPSHSITLFSTDFILVWDRRFIFVSSYHLSSLLEGEPHKQGLLSVEPCVPRGAHLLPVGHSKEKGEGEGEGKGR